MGMTGKSKKTQRADRKAFSVVEKDVDLNNISHENHMQMFNRLVAAGQQGIHNPPSPPKKKG